MYPPQCRKFVATLFIIFSVFISDCGLKASGRTDLLIEQSHNYPSITLDARVQCDLELLMNGGFDPLKGFLTQKDYDSVVEDCRLADGTLWPMPIVLPIEDTLAEQVRKSPVITLKDEIGNPLALLKVADVYKPDLDKECLHVYGTNDPNHSYVEYVRTKKNCHYVGGEIEKIQAPLHYDFVDLRLTPEQCKDYFQKNHWDKVVGFQTRNPLHKSHVALLLNSAENASDDGGAKIFLNPVVGVTQKGDVDYPTRVRCYKKVLEYLPEDKVFLCLLPLSMRMAGPREALLHALVRQNYGCTHFIVGRDHAGPSSKTQEGEPFYDPYAAQEFLEKYQKELQIQIIASKEIVHVEDLDQYLPVDQVPEGSQIQRLSGTEFRRRIMQGEPIPDWFSYPEVIDELRSSYSRNQGFCIYFTGLSGAGKSTLAFALMQRLQEADPLKRPIIIVDGDEVRNHLSKELGFSKKDRSANVQRIGYAASLIVRSGGIALCANIAPYQEDREKNRHFISQYGKYLECYVKTPLSTCERRDVKGLYKKARAGLIKEFTGISDPFEEPVNPEITVVGEGDMTETIDGIIKTLKEDAKVLF
ncbi:MAG: bifunctional sulfate adenylyltransferase/adenylylsulfate kinase [Waddliaceae bacterium]